MAAVEKIFHVFVSSTYLDLIDERKAVSEAIAKAGYVVEGMELFPASSQSQMSFIESVIDRCDYYVLLIGGRYGSVDKKSGKSFTQLEFEYAKSKGLIVLPFLQNGILDLPENKIETDKNKHENLVKFRELIAEQQLVKYWDSIKELPADVLAALTHATRVNNPEGWVRSSILPSAEVSSAYALALEENEKLKKELLQFSATNVDLKDIRQILEKEIEMPFYTAYSSVAITLGNVFLEICSELRLGATIPALQATLYKYFAPSSSYLLKEKDVSHSFINQLMMSFEHLGLVTSNLKKVEGDNDYLVWSLTEYGIQVAREEATSKLTK